MRKTLPITSFVLFLSAILAATAYYAPQWGLMDDYQNLYSAQLMLHGTAPFQTFIKDIWYSTLSWGIFRPVYNLWIFVVYNLFSQMPTAIYMLMALINMGAVLVWGHVFYKFYKVDKEDFYSTVYLFPLSFFLFTPFWNIFMYISLQEKFVFLFSALSFYFFKRSYETASKKQILITFLFLVLGVFSKPTTVAIAFIYAAFALLDVVLFKIRPVFSWIYFAVSSVLIGGYAAFLSKIQMKGQYTASYSHNLKPMVLIGKILAANLIIKFLFVLGIGSVLFFIVKFILTKNKNDLFGILLPSALLAFLILLMPWGYQSYLLCDLAPFVLGMFFPLYIWLVRRNSFSRWITDGLLLAMLTAVFIGIIMPRISKMGDIAKAESFITSQAVTSKHSRYFFPPPYIESAYALNGFTGEDIVYLGGTVAKSTLKKELPNGDAIFDWLMKNGYFKEKEGTEGHLWYLLDAQRIGIEKEYPSDSVRILNILQQALDGTLTDALLTDKGNNYLLVNDQCSGTRMKGVRMTEKVFSNKTWQIFHLVSDNQYTGEFQPLFKSNLIQDIKTTLRNL